MEPIGKDLIRARENQNLTLRQAAEATRISLRHLQNLEEARYGELPGGMYNRAFLRTYCEYLGLEPKDLLGRFDDETVTQHEKTTKAKTKVQPPTVAPKSHAIQVWFAILCVSVAGIYFSRSWISRVFSPYFSYPTWVETHRPPVAISTQQASVPQPSVSPPPVSPASQSVVSSPPPDLKASSPPEPALSAPEQPGSTPVPERPSSTSSPANPASMIRIEFQVVQKCWVSVKGDGNTVFSKLLEPGDDKSFDANERFYIILGNAGGVRLKINGKQSKPLGKPGEVVRVLINEQNIADLMEKATS